MLAAAVVAMPLLVLQHDASYAEPSGSNEGTHAVQLERSGRIDEAISAYRRHLDEHPADASIARRFMSLLYREKRYREIIDTYEKLDRALKTERDIISFVARAYLDVGEKDEGFAVLQSIITRAEGSLISYRYVGNTLLSLGYAEEAKEIFKQGRERWGKYSFAREFYHCFVVTKEWKDAFGELLNLSRETKVSKEWIKRELNALIEKDKTLLEYLKSLAADEAFYRPIAGELLLEHGEVEHAKRFLLGVLDPQSLFAFGELCIKKGYFKEAEEVLKQVAVESDEAALKEQALLRLAKTYREMGRIGEALDVLSEIIADGESFPDSAKAAKAEILLYETGEFAESRRLLEQLLEQDATLIQRDWFLTLIISGCIRSGDLARAEELAGASVSPLAFFYAGEVLFFRGAYVESRDTYKRAVARGLDRDFANNALERVMVMEGLQFNPELLALVSEIEFSVEREAYAEAIELINGAFDAFSDSGGGCILLYCKAKTYAHQGLINEAIASFINIVDVCPRSELSPKALYQAAVLSRERIGETALAGELLRRVIFDYPSSVEAELARRELQLLQ